MQLQQETRAHRRQLLEKIADKPNGNQSATNQPLGQQNNANTQKCTYCGMKNHTIDNFTLY